MPNVAWWCSTHAKNTQEFGMSAPGGLKIQHLKPPTSEIFHIPMRRTSRSSNCLETFRDWRGLREVSNLMGENIIPGGPWEF